MIGAKRPTLLGSCEQFALTCPEVASLNCDDLLNGGQWLACPVDLAAGLIPEDAASIAPPWAWSTNFLGVEGGDSNWTPGATGWSCELARATYDQHPTPDPLTGDNDGYPTLVDCDNNNPKVFPALPEHDGYTSEYCVEPDGRCYVCPDGPNPPPEVDDDDSAEPSDDDDSASLPPPDDDDAVYEEPAEPGCSVQGCSVSWTCADGGVAGVAIVMVGFRRRRPLGSRRITPSA